MKSGIIVVVLAGIVVMGGIAYAFHRTGDRPVNEVVAVTANPHGLSEVVYVDDLAKKPEDFKGELVLRGAVAGVSKTNGVFAVVDSREFESCGVLTCALNTIPVKFDGELPEPKTIVEITGRVIRGENGLIINAESVKAVK
ncbi:hypothetical protein MNBD_NITROSPIRAE03-1148 [hydrothermal vent metagenome]|uniref:Uncharacterized protein n=1 Tax=hydrothermal vent metagenome TaxID=652676 RepID=A0A3B1DRA6_9ZZZZ